MNAVSIRGLNKIYSSGTRALKDVDLDISEGDFFALLGANGAGKTTMIGILTEVVVKTSGQVLIFGYNLDEKKSQAQAKRLIGVMPQEFNFNMFEKVQDILLTQAGYFGIPRKTALPRAEMLLHKLGLWEKRSEPSRFLSGGMKRRLMIARALIHEPRLLILDEPTAGVDVELRFSMWDYLRDLNAKGTTILLTTHYLEEVEQMCRHAAFIKSGTIYKCDTVKNLTRLLEQETFVVMVKHLNSLQKLEGFHPVILDDHTLEVELNRSHGLNAFIQQLSAMGLEVVDIRPKGHRLERLFLNILKEQ